MEALQSELIRLAEGYRGEDLPREQQAIAAVLFATAAVISSHREMAFMTHVTEFTAAELSWFNATLN